MTLSFALSAETATFVLVAARVAGLIVIAPVFSSQIVPTVVRAALVVILAVAIMPLVPLVHGGSVLILGAGVTIQFVVGALMGSIMAMILSAFGIAGQVITYQLGLGLAVFANPGLVGASSMLSEWNSLWALFIYVALRGPELMVVAFRQSFTALPLTQLGIPTSALAFTVGVMSSVFAVGLLVAAPLMVAGLVSDLSIGVLSRAFPQINAFFMSLPLKLGLALLILLISLPLFFAIIPNALNQGWRDVSHLLFLLEHKP